MRTTKRSLLVCGLSLLLCVAMLAGTTYAWFTDSVTSANNKIQAGTLNIDLGIKAAGDADYVSVKANPDKVAFNYDKWEPGYTEWVNAKVSTTGNLALKYTMKIVANGEVSALADVIDVYYAASEVAKPAARDLSGLTRIGTLRDALNGTVVINDTLIPGSNVADFATLALHMQETAGNAYQGLSIGTDFSLQILATQYTYESDAFDDQYDALADETPDNAGWPFAVTNASATVSNDAASFTASVAPADGKATQVAITGLDDVNDDDTLTLNVKTQDLETANSKFTVAENNTAVAGIDLTLTDSANQQVTFEGGTATITTYILPGLDPAKVSVKYNGEGAVPTLVSYDAATGKLIFTTTHFSEYYVEYEGIWYYVAATGRAYATENDLDDAAFTAAREALGDSINKLNLAQIVAGYASMDYTYTEDVALYNYLISGKYGFTADWFEYDGFKYTADGVTIDDLVAMRNAYTAAYNSFELSYTIYPTLTNGFYATAERIVYEPFLAEF